MEEEDKFKAAKETLLYHAAEAWIWSNTKTAMIEQVKTELRTLITARSMGVPYREISETEMQAFIKAAKWNVFSVTDKAISASDGLYDVLKSIRTIRTRGEGYALEAARILAAATPAEAQSFAEGMFRDFDEDCKELVKSDLGALNIPEPWKGIAAKYLIPHIH
ncbi:hypothetical protein [Synechococcus sp. Cruz CV-v-12]|uniref:hypothetical protein n=1 Tax=Synechococcus sp. Cruz CV-v-12 TaxID=2823728 RepID=UPI0020CC3071|nr:hypothetical protein [Synechococcus sp. Cruz CV-v-12]MCP9874380.1 hypothetical protein [Synechococcus sp. Cruz CV-v-12]